LRKFIEKNYKVLNFIAMIGVAIYIAYIKGWIFADFKQISANEAINLIKKGTLVIDIRDKEQFKKGHIKGAINIPFEKLQNNLSLIEKYKDKELLICSKTGTNGIKISRILSKNGFKPINIKSGILGLAVFGGKNAPELFTK
jgi:rhodanese-related sulfurtransferase